MSNLVPFRSMLQSANRWPSFWDDDDFSLLSGSLSNSIDMYENENEVVVRANVAGVASDDVDITFEKGVLWIQARNTTQEESEEKDQKKYFSKASWNYSYKVAVPGFLDHSKEPEVELNEGVLNITFYKSAASKPKKLAIKSK